MSEGAGRDRRPAWSSGYGGRDSRHKTQNGLATAHKKRPEQICPTSRCWSLRHISPKAKALNGCVSVWVGAEGLSSRSSPFKPFGSCDLSDVAGFGAEMCGDLSVGGVGPGVELLHDERSERGLRGMGLACAP